MEKFKLNFLPERVFKFFIIYASISLFFIFAGIVPLSRYNAKLNKDIKELLFKIKEQKNLNLLYETLSKNVEKKKLQILPNAAKTTLSRQEANKFEEVFRSIATKSGLRIAAISPELTMLTNSSNSLSYTAVIRGEFKDFRKMLLGLGNISYIEKIEEISIQQQSDSLEFKIKILIALGN